MPLDRNFKKITREESRDFDSGMFLKNQKDNPEKISKAIENMLMTNPDVNYAQAREIVLRHALEPSDRYNPNKVLQEPLTKNGRLREDSGCMSLTRKGNSSFLDISR